jgi:glutamine synthetase
VDRTPFNWSGCESVFTVAALLAGIHHGLSVKKENPPPVEGNAYLISDTELQRTWEQARNSLEHA